ncbi:helix-turn-helix domain-containing protein [Cupriavidus basilensis]|uniref:helix-turn-helix domain-containing protein n=1 Tax=Cupriavidus basilensis TaxID=68895 RepID=UPI0023E8D69B|nr:LysR family transcriptional regulator [Cupriavidus basilensis]MDF3887976.1 LysR family transcriptional regulator [Cupriavidus basilensis]
MRKLEGVVGFVAVVEAGAISEAARRLRLSRTVVSDAWPIWKKFFGSDPAETHDTTAGAYPEWRIASGSGVH